jgi:hypothetical protein
MLHVGVDLSRHRLDVRVLDESGASIAELKVPPIAEELRRLAGGCVQAQTAVQKPLIDAKPKAAAGTITTVPAAQRQSPTIRGSSKTGLRCLT